jgi:hypothetical protein
MKLRGMIFLAGLVSLSGCAHQYVIKLNNGAKVSTQGKPKLEHGYYVYKDANGQPRSISQGRVVEIDRSSLAEDDKSKFKPPSQK